MHLVGGVTSGHTALVVRRLVSRVLPHARPTRVCYYLPPPHSPRHFLLGPYLLGSYLLTRAVLTRAPPSAPTCAAYYATTYTYTRTTRAPPSTPTCYVPPSTPHVPCLLRDSPPSTPTCAAYYATYLRVLPHAARARHGGGARAGGSVSAQRDARVIEQPPGGGDNQLPGGSSNSHLAGALPTVT